MPHAGHGFVQQEDAGIDGQNHGDFQLPLLAVRNLGSNGVGPVLETHLCQGLFSGFAHQFVAVAGHEQIEVTTKTALGRDRTILETGHFRVDVGLLEASANTTLDEFPGLQGVDALAFMKDTARGGLQCAAEHVQQCTLASAIGAHYAV